MLEHGLACRRFAPAAQQVDGFGPALLGQGGGRQGQLLHRQGAAGLPPGQDHADAAALGHGLGIDGLRRDHVWAIRTPEIDQINADAPGTGPAHGHGGPQPDDLLAVLPRIPLHPVRIEQGGQAEVEAGKIEVVHRVKADILQLGERPPVVHQHGPGRFRAAQPGPVGGHRMEDDLGIEQTCQGFQGVVQAQVHLGIRARAERRQKPLGLDQVPESGQLYDKVLFHG